MAADRDAPSPDASVDRTGGSDGTGRWRRPGSSAFLLYGLARPRFTREAAWAAGTAMLLAGLAAAWFPGGSGVGFPLLAWTAALVPLYILLYYRGWKGLAAGFAGVAVVVVGARLAASAWGALADPWADLPVFLWTLAAAGAAGAVVLEAVRSFWKSGVTDPATGLPDRRLVDGFLEMQLAAARRGRSLTVALLALDGCRDYDDRCAVEDRDVILERVGRLLRSNAREMDFIGRYGEDRFLAVMPGESSFGVSVFADRVRRQVADFPLPEPGGCTVSVGVASHEEGVGSAEALVGRAEDALAWARSLGGDRVILYGRPAYREGPVRPHYQAEKRPVV